jgi:hypothetical protein
VWKPITDLAYADEHFLLELHVQFLCDDGQNFPEVAVV